METSERVNIAHLHGVGETETLRREAPVNLEAEQALLAAILASNHAYERVADFLRPEHFAQTVHGQIFEACAKLIQRGQIANAVTLKKIFEEAEELVEVGGAQYLANLQSSYVSIINARDYGASIHDLYLRRQLIELGEDVVNEAYVYDLDTAATDQIESAEQRLYSLAETGQTEGGLQSFKSALIESIEVAEAAHKRTGHVAGVPTLLADLDKMLGGLHRSDLIILAGRPSMGKTALVTNIAYNAASSHRTETGPDGQPIEQQEVVAFFSLEMSAEQLATRILSQQAEIRGDAIRRGELSDEQFDKVIQYSRALHTLPLFIDDTPALTIPALRTRARRLKRQHGLSMIVVDYLQLMQGTSDSRGDGRVQEVSEITRGLKAIAKDLDVPVIALSQLSRQTEQRDDKRPQLSDLRESGSIEQDADVVMFIFREEYYKAREKPSQRANESDDQFGKRRQKHQEDLERARNVAEVIVAKQRHGPIGTVELYFNPEFTQFDNYSPGDHLPDGY